MNKPRPVRLMIRGRLHALAVTRCDKYIVDEGGDRTRTVSVFSADAEKVVRKEQQIMADGEFPEDYFLTVFPFTRDVSKAMTKGLILYTRT